MRAAFALFLLMVLPTALHAAPVVVEKSRVGFSARQMGVPVRGEFTKFDADVRFDPKDAKKSSARLTIDVASIDAGSEDATVEIKRRTWLDALNHPRAEFTSTSLTMTGPDRYTVTGDMTIKGRTREVSAPVTVKRGRGLWMFEGSFSLNRLDFGVGEGAWSDTGTVAAEVEVTFRLYVPVEASKKQP